MKLNKLFISLVAVCAVSLIASCDDVTDPQPSTISTVNRLIFEGDAETGGHLKVELSDTHIESLLDGNNSGVTSPLLIPSSLILPEHSSLISITLTDVNYYGETVADVSCSSNPDNKIELLWRGPIGDYYEGPNGYMYLDDTLGASQYILQGSSETMDEAAIVSYYYSNCTSSDGNAYRVSFYPDNDVLSHGIETTFDVDRGVVTGILRLHRIGDGHTPYIDLLF